MAKITTRLVKPESQVQWAGEVFRIHKVTREIAGVAKLAGYKVLLVDDEGEVQSVMLWETEEASETSKLGAFLKVLGDDTDTWEGQVIQFKSWTMRNRVIAPVTRPRRKVKVEGATDGAKPETATEGVAE